VAAGAGRASLSCEAAYFYFAPSEPLWVGLGWNAAFVTINLIQLTALARRPPRPAGPSRFDLVDLPQTCRRSTRPGPGAGVRPAAEAR